MGRAAMLLIVVAAPLVAALASSVRLPTRIVEPSARLSVRPAKTSPLRLANEQRRPSMSLAAVAGVYAPIAGIFTSNALYCAPLMAVLERTRAGSMGELNPVPAAVTVLSTVAWLQYGLASANPFVVASNLPGVAAAVAGLVLMLPLMAGAPALGLVQAIFVGGCTAIVGLWTWLVFSGMSALARAGALGLFASFLFVVLCTSPLASMRSIIASKDSSSIYAPMTFAQCVNCGLWTFYGFVAANDVFVWGPNLTGLLLGFAQLSLKIIFPSKQ